MTGTRNSAQPGPIKPVFDESGLPGSGVTDRDRLERSDRPEGRLSLRHDLYRAESEDGAFFLAHHGDIVLRGRSVHRWIDRLAPYLDGSLTLGDITSALPRDRRQYVESLITSLLRRGVVRERPHDRRPDDRSRADAAESPEDPPEVGFLGYFHDAPVSSFERYRDSAVLVAGSEALVPFVVRALLCSGCRRIRTTSSAVPSGGRVERRTAATTAERQELISASDAVVRVSDRASADPELDELCAERAIPLAQAALLAGEAWLSPLGGGSASGAAGDGGAGSGRAVPWSAGLRRLTGKEPIGEPVDTTLATVVANQLVQRLFLTTTGVRTRMPTRRIDAESLAGSDHELLAHPFGVAAGTETAEEFADRIAQLELGPRFDAEEFSRRTATCADARTGIFAEVRRGALAQLPLRVSRTTVTDPVGLLPPDAPRPVVTGAGCDFATARQDAALAALERYASLMVDPRRLLTEDGRPLVTPDAAPERALEALRAEELAGWVRGFDLVDRRVRLVRADSAFPPLRGDFAAPVGVSAADDWPAAVEAGLAAHCERWTVAEARSAHRRFPQLDPWSRCADGATEDFLHLLAAVGEHLAVHDVTGRLGVPAVAFCLGGRTASYACASTISAALHRGAKRALLSYQARREAEPAELPDVAELPEGARGEQFADEPSRDPVDLAAALARRGHRPVVVPLDHDREVHRAVPGLVHVVVCHDND